MVLQVLADSLMMEVRMKGSMKDLKLVNSCHRRLSLSQSFSFALSVSASATLLINTQGSPSDIQWPALVSPVVNNKLFGFKQSGFCFTAALFSLRPHCGIWGEL